jgi:hypothetical protein
MAGVFALTFAGVTRRPSKLSLPWLYETVFVFTAAVASELLIIAVNPKTKAAFHILVMNYLRKIRGTGKMYGSKVAQRTVRGKKKLGEGRGHHLPA